MFNTFEIPESNKGLFLEKLSKLSKRAVKLGFEPFKIKETGSFEREFKGTDYSHPFIVKYIKFDVESEEPKFKGWSFIATIEPHASGNVIRSFSDEPLSEVYRTSFKCDHCGIARYRTRTFIVHSETEGYKQVGSSCLKDFLGHGDADKIARYCEVLLSVEDFYRDRDGEGYGREKLRFSVKLVLTAATGVIWSFGWISSTKAKEDGLVSSASVVSEYLLSDPSSKYHKELSDDIESYFDSELADKVVDWVNTLPEEKRAKSDYLHNLYVLFQESIEPKSFGYVVSAIAAYKKEIEASKPKEDSVKSDFFGTVDKREVFTLTLKRIVPVENDFGTSYIHFFVDENGNKATWFSSRFSNFEEDKTYVVKATVKKHDVYNNENITYINRVSLK